MIPNSDSQLEGTEISDSCSNTHISEYEKNEYESYFFRSRNIGIQLPFFPELKLRNPVPIFSGVETKELPFLRGRKSKQKNSTLQFPFLRSRNVRLWLQILVFKESKVELDSLSSKRFRSRRSFSTATPDPDTDSDSEFSYFQFSVFRLRV
jgi:hypothetical protein